MLSDVFVQQLCECHLVVHVIQLLAIVFTSHETQQS